jgi:hypothetical protein
VKAEEAARKISVERARGEVAEADAKKAVAEAAEAAQREAEAQRAEEVADLEAARQHRRDRWSGTARRAGEVAASIGIVALAVFGADRIFQWPDAASRVNVPGARSVPVTQPAAANPPAVDAGGVAGPVVSDSMAFFDGMTEAGSFPLGTDGLVVLPPGFESAVPDIEDPEVVPAGADPRLFVLDAFADSADGAMVYYHSLSAAFESGDMGCDELQAAYVEVDSRWVSYILNGVSRMDGDLDEQRASRHEELSQDARRIELSYEVTGCPVP